MKVLRSLFVGAGATVLFGSSLALAAGASTIAPAAAGTGGLFQPAPLPGGVQAQAVGAVPKEGSTNWSGYAQNDAKGTYTDVVDTWVVPTVNTSAKGHQYSSDWVGVGGYSEDTLVQAGTEADNIKGKAQYDAWTEILPAAEVPLAGFTIEPGDQITTTVVEISTNKWDMTVKDDTTGKSGSRTVSYTSSGESAEAIHERPEVGGSLATLAKTTKVTFVPGDFSTAAPGATPVLKPLITAATGAKLHEILMVNNGDTKTIASPSNPSAAKDGFAVADGAKAPAPPAG
jgi:hypothetical protein